MNVRDMPDVIAAKLTVRELEVLSFMGTGMLHGDRAAAMNMSVKTQSTHREHLCDKLGSRHDPVIVRWAIFHGLIDVETGTATEELHDLIARTRAAQGIQGQNHRGLPPITPLDHLSREELDAEIARRQAARSA